MTDMGWNGVTAMALVALACQSGAPGEPSLDRRSAPPSTLTFRVGDTKLVHGVSVTFQQVLEDSRCPTDVVCVWEGNASVELAVGPAVGRGPTHQVILNTSVEPREGRAWDLRIRLVQLDPAPRSIRPTPAREYVVRLEISGVAADATPVLSVTTDRSRYAPGEAVSLRLVNPTDRSYWFNVCTDPLERRQGREWVTVWQDRACIAIAQALRAGETTQAPYPLERGLADGEYRIAVRLGDSVVVRSNSFYVGR